MSDESREYCNTIRAKPSVCAPGVLERRPAGSRSRRLPGEKGTRIYGQHARLAAAPAGGPPPLCRSRGARRLLPARAPPSRAEGRNRRCHRSSRATIAARPARGSEPPQSPPKCFSAASGPSRSAIARSPRSKLATTNGAQTATAEEGGGGGARRAAAAALASEEGQPRRARGGPVSTGASFFRGGGARPKESQPTGRMARPTIKRRHTDLQLESVARLSSLPIVESGIGIAGNVYEKIKRSNSLMGWGLDTAEQSLAAATATAIPAIILLNVPIMTIDQLLCKGIDIVEQRVPAIHLPPHLMYWNTREYVNNKFVKPVLIRADSMKMIGSQAANAAVERLEGAINAADQYVDHYLPADPADKIAETCTDSANCTETSNKAVRTIEHGARFSRKLQRRLTRRTLAEARALKEQGTECIHVLLYVVELIATDPKLAWQKAKELWASLSLPEPENQARPTNLEQLLVLFTRETARRIVHLVNGAASLAGRAPSRLGRSLLRLSHRLLGISEKALQVTKDSLYPLLGELLVAASLLLGPEPAGPPRDLLPRPGAAGLAGSCLSLVASVSIVPMKARPASSSSSSSPAAPRVASIRELRAGEDEEEAEEAPRGKGAASRLLLVRSNGREAAEACRWPRHRSALHACNGHSKIGRAFERSSPFLAKPVPAIRQKH